MNTKDKLLEKLAKLKAHAESAQALGSEAEAQAFADMLQQMLLRHKLEMSDVELVDLEKEDPIDRHPVNFSAQGLPRKKVRQAWSQHLAETIAWAHFCRILVYNRSNRVTFVGRKQDCEVAEYMFVTLYKATERIADAAYAKFSTECVRQCAYCQEDKASCTGRYHEFEPNWARARGFRPAFVEAFVWRLARRFYDLRKQAEASSSTALVRLNTADQAVVKWMEDNKIKKSEDLGGNQRENWDGYRQGQAAADEVSLRANAMQGAGTKKYLP
jgi:hypothetical protein